MKKITAATGAIVIALALTACGGSDEGYSEEDLCNDTEQYNSAPQINGDAIAPAAFVAPMKGGGGRGGSSGGGRSSSGSSGGSKSSGSGYSWGNKSKSNTNSGTKSGGFGSGIKTSWKSKSGTVVKDTSGKYRFQSKPKYKSRGTYRSGYGVPFIFIGDDGNEYTVYCD